MPSIFELLEESLQIKALEKLCVALQGVIVVDQMKIVADLLFELGCLTLAAMGYYLDSPVLVFNLGHNFVVSLDKVLEFADLLVFRILSS